jgi:hypothetical protein
MSILLVPLLLFVAAFRAADSSFLSSCSFEHVLNRAAAPSNFCSFDRMLFCIRSEESRTEPILLAVEQRQVDSEAGMAVGSYGPYVRPLQRKASGSYGPYGQALIFAIFSLRRRPVIIN